MPSDDSPLWLWLGGLVIGAAGLLTLLKEALTF